MPLLPISSEGLFTLAPFLPAPLDELLRHPDFRMFSFLTKADTNLFLTRLVIHLDACSSFVFLGQHDRAEESDEVDLFLRAPQDQQQDLIHRLRKLCYTFYLSFEEAQVTLSWSCRVLVHFGLNKKLYIYVLV